ncbi:MAG: hypothetical protein RIC15_02270 [Vicingaceae bacterium]
MDQEKRLLLLQLKSDLKEVLRLAREKSDELASEFEKNGDHSGNKVVDLEYYLTSLLEITKEMKKLCNNELKVEPGTFHVNIDSQEFDDFLMRLSNTNDTESLLELLTVLEAWERYELCAKVNEKIKLVMDKSA